MTPAQVRMLERLPAAAAAIYREACAATGERRVALLRDTQDAVDAGAAGMLAVYGELQAEKTDALYAAAFDEAAASATAAAERDDEAAVAESLGECSKLEFEQGDDDPRTRELASRLGYTIDKHRGCYVPDYPVLDELPDGWQMSRRDAGQASEVCYAATEAHYLRRTLTADRRLVYERADADEVHEVMGDGWKFEPWNDRVPDAEGITWERVRVEGAGTPWGRDEVSES